MISFTQILAFYTQNGVYLGNAVRSSVVQSDGRISGISKCIAEDITGDINQRISKKCKNSPYNLLLHCAFISMCYK